MLKALLPNHLAQTASGKFLDVALLPSGWDRDIQVRDDGWHVLITSITPKVMLDVKILLAQQGVN
jgi:hypothetical protein